MAIYELKKSTPSAPRPSLLNNDRFLNTKKIWREEIETRWGVCWPLTRLFSPLSQSHGLTYAQWMLLKQWKMCYPIYPHLQKKRCSLYTASTYRVYLWWDGVYGCVLRYPSTFFSKTVRERRGMDSVWCVPKLWPCSSVGRVWILSNLNFSRLLWNCFI